MIRIDPPFDELRRERVEQQTFARLDAIREMLAVPAGEGRRDRVERNVFERLSAMRGIERSETFVRPRRSWVPIAALASAAAVAIVLVVALRGGGDELTREPVITQHVVPPGGTGVRWTSERATIEAFGDTAVEQRIDDTGVTLTLARGKVDCDVEPRPDRPPFRVIAGDITISVVGTRFAVHRTAAGVRVDVVRGKVRVASPAGESMLGAGDAWSSAIVANGTPSPSPSSKPGSDGPQPKTDPTTGGAKTDKTDDANIELEPQKPKPKPVSGQEAFEQATRLEKRDLAASARMYRVAASGDSPTYAALALYSLAELERRRGASTTALRVIDEYLRRFPRGANVEELVWLRVDIYRAAKQTLEMNTAARDYLRRFPAGTYAKPAQSLVGGSR